MKKLNKKKGFTIVELVIVIAVVGVLTAVLVPTFVNLTNQARKAENQTFVKNLNTQMAIREATEGKNKTMYEAMMEAEDIGYNVEKLTPVDGNDVVWDSVANRFAIVGSDYATSKTVVYADGEIKATSIHQLWKIYDRMPATQTYSIYAKEGWNVADADISNLTVGFDAGKNTGIATVSYIGTSSGSTLRESIEGKTPKMASSQGQEVVIRTNGTGTALTVIAPNDIVHHYDYLDKLTITDIASDSYHEHGYVAFLEVTKGHVVIESDAEGVGTLNVKTANATVDIAQGAEVNKVLASSAEAQAKVNGAEATIATEEQVAAYANAATRYAGGLGTETEPYLILAASHIASLEEDVENENDSGKHYKVIGDLVLDNHKVIGATAQPTGSTAAQGYTITSLKEFDGIFDGGNHKISYSILITGSSGTGAVGFFSYIKNATIKNVVFNANIDCQRASIWVGGIAGFAEGVCNFENITMNGNIVSGWDVGGFIGATSGFGTGSFTNCANNASVTINCLRTGTNYAVAGGFIGQGNFDSNHGSLTFDRCANNGVITVNKANTADLSATASNFVGFVSDNSYGTYNFNNCTVGSSANVVSTIGYSRTVNAKTVYCAYSAENEVKVPAIKYVGITSNTWGATAAVSTINVNGVTQTLTYFE